MTEPLELADEFFVRSYDHSIEDGPSYASGSFVIPQGRPVVVTVEGNFTIWGDPSTMLGTPLPFVFPLPGDELSGSWASRDPAFVFAYLASHAPSGWSPGRGSSFLFSTTGTAKANFFRQNPRGFADLTAPAPGHLYTYDLVGAGHVLRAGIDDPEKHDNSGGMRVRVYLTAGGWKVGRL